MQAQRPSASRHPHGLQSARQLLVERQQPPPIATDECAADNRRVRPLPGPLGTHPIHHHAAVGRQLHDLRVYLRPIVHRTGMSLRGYCPWHVGYPRTHDDRDAHRDHEVDCIAHLVAAGHSGAVLPGGQRRLPIGCRMQRARHAPDVLKKGAPEGAPRSCDRSARRAAWTSGGPPGLAPSQQHRTPPSQGRSPSRTHSRSLSRTHSRSRCSSTRGYRCVPEPGRSPS